MGDDRVNISGTPSLGKSNHQHHQEIMYYDSEDPSLTLKVLDTIKIQNSTSDFFTLAVQCLDFFNFYYLVIIVVLGMMGNTLNFLVFTQTHLRLRSSSYYLAALALADIGFLLTLLIVWLDHVGIDLFNRQGFCQALIYGSSVFSCLSVWLTVAYTFERLTAVQYPLQRSSMCTVRRAKIIIGVLTFFTLSLHIYSLFTAGISSTEDDPDYYSCGLLPYYYKAMHIVNLVDTVVTLVIPLILILVMNALIAKNLFVFSRTFRKPPAVVQHGITIQMKHLKDPEDPPHPPIKGACQEPDSGHAESNLSSQLHSSQNSNSRNDHQRQHSPTRKNKSSSRIAMKGMLRVAASQQNGSTPGATLASADGSAETLVNHQVLAPVGTTSSANSPPSNNAAQLNRITILHQEAATQFNRLKHTEEKLQHRNILSIGIQYSITKMLLLISSVFIMLNMPSYVIRLQVFVNDVMATKTSETSSTDWLLQQFFMLLYYTNFSINFLLYSTCGTTFRHCLCRLLRDKVNAVRNLAARLRGMCSCFSSSSV